MAEVCQKAFACFIGSAVLTGGLKALNSTSIFELLSLYPTDLTGALSFGAYALGAYALVLGTAKKVQAEANRQIEACEKLSQLLAQHLTEDGVLLQPFELELDS